MWNYLKLYLLMSNLIFVIEVNQIIENIINEINKLEQKNNMIIEKILENPKINKNLLTLPTITIEEFELMDLKMEFFALYVKAKALVKMDHSMVKKHLTV